MVTLERSNYMGRLIEHYNLFIYSNSVRVAVTEGENIYVCLFDILKYIGRSEDMKIGIPQRLCKSLETINIAKSKSLYYILRSDIITLAGHYKIESKSISQKCGELIKWHDMLPSVIKIAKNNNMKSATVKEKPAINVSAGCIAKFSNADFGTIRTATINNEPYFVGNDVAGTLGYLSPKDAVRTHVDSEDKILVQLSDIQEGGESPLPNEAGSKITVINESGLYSLILRSKLPSAKQFKRWVTSEVLPEIRKTGNFTFNVNREDTDVEIMAKAHVILERTLSDMKKREELNAPKVEYYDEMVENRDYFTTSAIANELRVSAFILNRLLIESEICEIGKDGNPCVTKEFAHLQCVAPYVWNNNKTKKPKVIRTLKRWNKEGREFIIKIFKDGIESCR